MLRRLLPQADARLRRTYFRWRLALCRRPIRAHRGGIVLELAAPDDEQMLQYFLCGASWCRSDTRVFRDLLGPGDVAIDIGANVGFVTTIVARLVGPEGHVVAIEPCRGTFAQLLRTLELNAPLPVTSLNLACGADAGTAEIYAISASSGLNTMRPSLASTVAKAETVAVEPLDSIVERLALQKLTLLKVDVEGYEEEVLAGARRTLRTFRPAVYFEVSDTYRDHSRRACALLRSLGYTVNLPEEELAALRGVRNVLACPTPVS